MKLKRILFTILQCTWGIIQTFLGAVIFIKLRKYPHMRYRGCVDTRWNISSGLSLGLFIFTPGEEDEDSQKIRVHEYGHCIQSIVLGPLYMLLGIMQQSIMLNTMRLNLFGYYLYCMGAAPVF